MQVSEPTRQGGREYHGVILRKKSRGGVGGVGGSGSKIDEKTRPKKAEKTINEPYKKGCYSQYNG